MDSKKGIGLIKKIIKNEAFIFILGKYFAYSLQFINAILIAKILGPYEFGIYGFIILIIRYIRFFNPGAHYAVNVELATHNREDIKEANNIASNGLFISVLSAIFLLIIASALYFFDIPVFPKYDFSNYLILTAVISIAIILNLFFTNVYRSYSKFYQILSYLVLPQLFLLIMLFVAPEAHKITYLFYGFLAGHLVAVFLFLIGYPLKFTFQIDYQLQKLLLKRGIALAFYNASFYFIMISSRTIVSIFYDVESLGLYSFANSVAQAAILILGVVAFIFFPKILNRLKGGQGNNETSELLQNIRRFYISASYLIVFVVVIIYTFLMLFMEQYKTSQIAFLFLILMQLMISKVFGYSHILIARGQEGQIAKYAFITVLINIALCLGGIYAFDVGFSGVACCTFISVLFYAYMVVRKGKLMINEKSNMASLASELFPLRFIIPLGVLIVEKVFINELYTSIIPFVILVLLNFRIMIDTFKKFVMLISNKNAVKF